VEDSNRPRCVFYVRKNTSNAYAHRREGNMFYHRLREKNVMPHSSERKEYF